MEHLTFEDLQEVHAEIIFLIGIADVCFAFFANQRIKYLKEPIHKIEQCLEPFHFVRTDYQTLVNTLFYVNNIEESNEIVLKNGITLKVSRRKWKLFMKK